MQSLFHCSCSSRSLPRLAVCAHHRHHLTMPTFPSKTFYRDLPAASEAATKSSAQDALNFRHFTSHVSNAGYAFLGSAFRNNHAGRAAIRIEQDDLRSKSCSNEVQVQDSPQATAKSLCSSHPISTPTCTTSRHTDGPLLLPTATPPVGEARQELLASGHFCQGRKVSGCLGLPRWQLKQ